MAEYNHFPRIYGYFKISLNNLNVEGNTALKNSEMAEIHTDKNTNKKLLLNPVYSLYIFYIVDSMCNFFRCDGFI